VLQALQEMVQRVQCGWNIRLEGLLLITIQCLTMRGCVYKRMDTCTGVRCGEAKEVWGGQD